MTNRKDRDILDLKLLKRILLLALPFKKYVLIATLLTIVTAALTPVQPKLIQYTLDNYIMAGDLDKLFQMTLVLIAVLVIQSIIMFLSTYVTSLLGQQVIKKLRVTVFKHIVSLKLRFFDRTPVGTMVTRSISDIETIAEIFAQGFIQIAGQMLQLVVITVAMFTTDWKLSLLCLSVLPFLIWASNWFRKGVKIAFQRVRTQVAHLNAFVQEHITGISIVQIFNREDAEAQKFREINRAHMRANKKAIFHYALFFPIVEVITATSLGLLVWYGTRNAIDGSISAGVITAFILYLNMFFRPIRMMADRFNSMQMGMVAAERIFKLIDDKDQQEKDGEKEIDIKGEIEFRDVWFSYAGDEEYILKSASFKVHHGQTLAIVGPTGAGKSSIINILMRFYEFQKGEILIDGNPIQDLKLENLRSQIAVVLQDVFLFSGSIEKNIRLNTDSITTEQVIEAADQIGARDFIMKLTGGLDYDVRERGSALSTGQRQLISFIRAIAFDPRILILDEATSSIDTETEELIQNAIKVLLKGRTSIVIAHRLSTVQDADNILVIDKGRIVETGNHKELLEKGGKYAELYYKQLAMTEEDL